MIARWRECASHTRTDVSSDPDPILRPSGLNAIDVTHSECPSKVATQAPDSASHTHTDVSADPESTRSPPAPPLAKTINTLSSS